MTNTELMNLARLRIGGGYDFLSDFIFSLDSEGDYRKVSFSSAMNFFNEKHDTVIPSTIAQSDEEYRERLRQIGLMKT